MTGRIVEADEALRIGLVDRVAEPGTALDEAIRLAEEIASKPWTSLTGDRMSTYEQWGSPLPDALANEHRHGLRAIQSGEAVSGAGRFDSGAGRHGASIDQ
jgi:enoyl-CoA hydratase